MSEREREVVLSLAHSLSHSGLRGITPKLDPAEVPTLAMVRERESERKRVSERASEREREREKSD